MRRPIATALRLWRIKEGLSQDELAKRLDLPRPRVAEHENFTYEGGVSEKLVERYAAAYRMDPLDFLLAILAHAKAHPDGK